MPSWTLRVLFGPRPLVRSNTRPVDGIHAEDDQYQARHNAKIESHTQRSRMPPLVSVSYERRILDRAKGHPAMRGVLQRVSRASVSVSGACVGRIGLGWLVLLGVAKGDTEQDAKWLAEKLVNLRAFEEDQGKMNLSVADVGGSVLVVSQFTLLGDCRGGRRPSFTAAAEPGEAERLYLHFVESVRTNGIETATGTFRAMMEVELVNSGPVTLLLDSRKTF
jgi:D-tyrosyl-tRNA(Tyr) deacylase